MHDAHLSRVQPSPKGSGQRPSRRYFLGVCSSINLGTKWGTISADHHEKPTRIVQDELRRINTILPTQNESDDIPTGSHSVSGSPCFLGSSENAKAIQQAVIEPIELAQEGEPVDRMWSEETASNSRDDSYINNVVTVFDR